MIFFRGKRRLFFRLGPSLSLTATVALAHVWTQRLFRTFRLLLLPLPCFPFEKRLPFFAPGSSFSLSATAASSTSMRSRLRRLSQTPLLRLLPREFTNSLRFSSSLQARYSSLVGPPPLVKVYVSLPTEIHDNREKVRGRQITGLDKLVKKGVHVVVSFGLVDVVEGCINI